MNELALFAGAGGGILGTRLLGFRAVCAVEIEPYCREILLRRQEEKILEPFPIWDDVRTFDGAAWRGKVDIVTGGFPCQDISPAGPRIGIEGCRSGLWKEMFRIIQECEPEYSFIENSSALVNRGLDTILGDLASIGHDAKWGIFSACSIGAPHTRERLFLVSHSNKINDSRVGNKQREIQDNRPFKIWGNSIEERTEGYFRIRLETESECSGMVNGFPYRNDRIAAIGNAQVPAVVRAAWRLLK